MAIQNTTSIEPENTITAQSQSTEHSIGDACNVKQSENDFKYDVPEPIVISIQPTHAQFRRRQSTKQRR